MSKMTEIVSDRFSSGSHSTSSATAAVLVSPRRFRIEQTELPVPGSNQVRIQMEGCGVCGSNIPVWEGRSWFQYPQEPGAPGHEGWGMIDAVGDEVTELIVGQRVACLSYHAFAQYDLADAGNVAVLPAELDGVSFPAEPLACAINVMRRCRIEPGESVAIIGVGFLGALLVQLAVAAGANVTAISRRSYARLIAEQSGARETFALEDYRLGTSQCLDKYSCVIEATGTQEALDLATALVSIRGKLVVAGYHQDGLRQINMQQWNWKGIDAIQAHERDPQIYVQGMKDAIESVVSGVIKLDDLITHETPLSDIDIAFSLAARRPGGFLKAVVRF
jgi:2-desacetyl-2-hydroxyethyl bacteriochlorophyllide A dehydrogenase